MYSLDRGRARSRNKRARSHRQLNTRYAVKGPCNPRRQKNSRSLFYCRRLQRYYRRCNDIVTTQTGSGSAVFRKKTSRVRRMLGFRMNLYIGLGNVSIVPEILINISVINGVINKHVAHCTDHELMYPFPSLLQFSIRTKDLVLSSGEQ